MNEVSFNIDLATYQDGVYWLLFLKEISPDSYLFKWFTLSVNHFQKDMTEMLESLKEDEVSREEIDTVLQSIARN